MKPFTKKIVLESGREFYGYGVGADREATGEIVFNPPMVGNQESRGNGSVPPVDATPARFHGPMMR